MLRFFIGVVTLAAWQSAGAAERTFDFSSADEGQTPPGFRSAISGEGKPGSWKIVLDEAVPAFPAITQNTPNTTKRKVLAQLARDVTDEHFPLLIFEDETYGDFTLTTRFKSVGGDIEQMAGVAFRIQDEKNYYVVRASSIGNTFRFYKFVNGERSQPIGPELEIPKGIWHELAVECKGNQIRCQLDGKEVIPPLTDNSFSRGKIGFWTKSDSVCYYSDARIVYTPRENLAQALVRETVALYPRLVGLQIYASSRSKPGLSIVASTDANDLGKPGAGLEQDVIDRDSIYYGKDNQTVTVTMPLHDRNGDTVAAVRVVMKSFPGQTEQNAIARATPIIKRMEGRVGGGQGFD